ncbi:MAG: SUMF1/EgtB/PvdO family nonheme iron enzyme [Anaerolineales bacterium]|nr:SUMF1/EgtB/PvdO family nonheme iron enzyme [Anaerolineales bacterium]
MPIHQVWLDSCWIDRTEVTNSQYALCVEDSAFEPPLLNSDYLGREYDPDPQYAHYPVIYGSWYIAIDCCAWTGRRLPAEAEWEKAACCNDARRYPWGNEPLTADRAHFCDVNCPKDHANPNYDNGFPLTAPVGSFPAGASPYSVLDMAGNVLKWTGSLPMPYPNNASDGREEEDGYQYIWRGCPWSNGIWRLRSSLRYRSVPYYWYNYPGFRCAMPDS